MKESLVIRQSFLSRFFDSVVLFAIGVLMLRNAFYVAGVGLCVVACALGLKALFLSPKVVIDGHTGLVSFITFRRIQQQVQTVSRGSIKRLIKRDRMIDEQPDELILELKDGSTLLFPEGAYRNYLKIWRRLSEIEEHPIPVKEE